MSKLLQTFVEIALWRKGPQDLPASRNLALVVLALYVAVEFIGVQLFDVGIERAMVYIGVDVIMLSGWLWLVLAFFSRSQRFVQTLTATLGVGVLILLLDITARVLQLLLGVQDTAAFNLLRVIVIALVLGRIFMHALDRGLVTGMALTIAIIYSTDAVAQLMVARMAAG